MSFESQPCAPPTWPGFLFEVCWALSLIYHTPTAWWGWFCSREAVWLRLVYCLAANGFKCSKMHMLTPVALKITVSWVPGVGFTVLICLSTKLWLQWHCLADILSELSPGLLSLMNQTSLDEVQTLRNCMLLLVLFESHFPSGVFLECPYEFDGDKVFGTQANFSLQMNI